MKLITIVLMFAALPAAAADVNWFKVTRDGSRVDIRAEIVIDAPAADVYAALISYDRFASMGDTFAASYYLEPSADGVPRIYTRTEGCIVFFCKTIERYARLELQSQTNIRAVAEPELSDAALSVESWSLSSEGAATVIEYHHELDTGFWVPPLLGTMMISRSVRQGTRNAAERIEAIALEQGRVTIARNEDQ